MDGNEMGYFINITLMIGIAILLVLCIVLSVKEVSRAVRSNAKEDQGRKDLEAIIKTMRSR